MLPLVTLVHANIYLIKLFKKFKNFYTLCKNALYNVYKKHMQFPLLRLNKLCIYLFLTFYWFGKVLTSDVNSPWLKLTICIMMVICTWLTFFIHFFFLWPGLVSCNKRGCRVVPDSAIPCPQCQIEVLSQGPLSLPRCPEPWSTRGRRRASGRRATLRPLRAGAHTPAHLALARLVCWWLAQISVWERRSDVETLGSWSLVCFSFVPN